MEKAFKNLVKAKFPFFCGNKLLLAVSGGIDSMAMVHLCKSAKLDFSIAHCNFNLRGDESDADEKFVVEVGESLGVEVYTQSFNTEKYADNHRVSTQMAARQLRYEWFDELCNSLNFDYILTAHHADDNLETFLINLIRGTGPEGLTGIKTENNNIIRPLLNFRRIDIEAYAETKKFKWREDSSNATDKYMRNKIRHRIIPVMKDINPQLLEGFADTQNHLRENLELVEDYISLIYPKMVERNDYGYALDVEFLKKIPHSKQILYQLLKSFGFKEWNDVYELLFAQSGKIVFSDTHRLIKDRKKLLLTELEDKVPNLTFEILEGDNLIMLPRLGTFHICEVHKIGKLEKSCIYVPKRKIQYPLELRKWRKGDYFYPFGMHGKKKLSDFFKDEKFSLPQKENTWLLCSGKDIIWIVNHRADNRYAVEPADKEILKFSVHTS